MDKIGMTIKREWFAQIVEGSKRIEYREIKPYWTARLRKVRTPFVLVLRNGYSPGAPVVTVRIDRVVPSPQGKAKRGDYALHIGKVLKVERWDAKRKAGRQR
jgi:hypothetical protein